MIQIVFVRYGLTVIAATATDNNDVHIAAGLTERHARKKLLKSIDKYYAEKE